MIRDGARFRPAVLRGWIASLLLSTALSAQEPTDFSGEWRLGDASGTSTTAGTISLSDPWTAHDLPSSAPFSLTRTLLASPNAGPLAIGVGRLAFGNYEVWADGRLLGGRGELGAPPSRPLAMAFEIPDDVMSDGRVEIRLVVDLWSSARAVAGESRPAVQGLIAGPAREILLTTREANSRMRLGALSGLIFAVVSLLVGLYHLVFHLSRPQEKTYLWFGLGCLFFAANAWIPSPWSLGAIGSFELVYRLTDASGHLAVFCFVPFLGAMLSVEVTRGVRIYQLSHLLLAAGVVLLPIGVVVGSAQARLIWLLVFLVAAVWLLGRQAWRGDPDARVLAAGAVLMVLAEFGEYLRIGGANLPSYLPQAGFSAVLLSMSAALAMRFSRAHNELDTLRVSLTRRVAERTADLAEVTAQAEAASRAKSVLLSTLSHELREPLKSIVAFSSILRSAPEGVDERGRDFAQRIERSGRYALRLVSDLLDMSRLETGRIRVETVDVDLGELVNEITIDMRPGAEARAVELLTEIPAAPAIMQTDPYRLRQVLINLVGNGIKFAPGGVVTTRIVTDPTGPVAIEVMDTGVGISGTLLAEITHGLTEAQIPSTPREGAGIGLQIARELCNLLDYELSFSSTPGNGTLARVGLTRRSEPAQPGLPDQS